MSKFKINGGIPINGEVELAGNKNAALPIICATILADGDVKLRNVPKISDVKTLLRIMRSLGSKITYSDRGHSVIINNDSIKPDKLDKDLVGKFRGSILLMGPLLAKFKSIQTWVPGGCNIGQRPIDTHLLSLEKLGAQITVDDWIKVDADNMVGGYIWLDEASVTATENLIMASVFANGVTEIYNAACEPHVQDLCNFLNSMGAKIEGIGSNRIIIHGVSGLNGGEWAIIKDHMEAVNFISAALITNGSVFIKDVPKEHMNRIMFDFTKLGLNYRWEGNNLFIPKNTDLVIKKTFGGRINKIDCFPWPGFPTDVLQYMVVNATKAQGQIIIHDKLFENRLFFFDQINQMGANIIMCDPHRLVVSGPTQLKGRNLVALDIRGGASLVIAALGARGESIIDKAEIIDRGYEDFEVKLSNLGAEIVRIR